MTWTLVSNILLPTFTWPHRVLGSVALASSIPPAPQRAHQTIRRLVGFLPSYLPRLSRRYCTWVGIEFKNQIVQLPFGIVLKWSDGTRLEEVSAMMIARSAGVPDLGLAHKHLNEKELQTISNEMHAMQIAMQSWPHPWGGERICSVMGTSIRSAPVPNHSIGPCESESKFNDYLPSVASEYHSPSRDVFEQRLACVRKLHSVHHPIVFTHGDLKHHNSMVHNGHASGSINWESAGCERALTSLTVDSYAW
ncbi:uncharacterized protein BDR25DRAFT_331020 [Lindgomyces ingoldianus]|uniref:Uncharacterized protein n=1 Tax=Lindgomyces ingoldianus TaxID=673940 RepID=A0ACB6RCX1_9PLEO|nr:uncharacterized protein BDR25DRAFT_331020 [Lindgomyces ingoldianus]KAF2477183.1 hypothetical protein BDR25DRAFT_331020 [Lindgomyces ingoldianus]